MKSEAMSVRARAMKTAADTEAIEAALPDGTGAIGTWGDRCHEISLAVLRTGLFGPGRVARGWCKGVGGQHSWIVLGDPYDRASTVVDPTLWKHQTPSHPHVIIRRNLVEHSPHGMGSVWNWGRPLDATGERLDLAGYDELSPIAKSFLEVAGYPLDYRGWCELGSCPVQEWPAAEIIKAMYQDERLRNCPKIDHVGMLTDLNPEGLYW